MKHKNKDSKQTIGTETKTYCDISWDKMQGLMEAWRVLFVKMDFMLSGDDKYSGYFVLNKQNNA